MSSRLSSRRTTFVHMENVVPGLKSLRSVHKPSRGNPKPCKHFCTRGSRLGVYCSICKVLSLFVKLKSALTGSFFRCIGSERSSYQDENRSVFFEFYFSLFFFVSGCLLILELTLANSNSFQ